jgi:hypothetical protein
LQPKELLASFTPTDDIEEVACRIVVSKAFYLIRSNAFSMVEGENAYERISSGPSHESCLVCASFTVPSLVDEMKCVEMKLVTVAEDEECSIKYKSDMMSDHILDAK